VYIEFSVILKRRPILRNFRKPSNPSIHEIQLFFGKLPASSGEHHQLPFHSVPKCRLHSVIQAVLPVDRDFRVRRKKEEGFPDT
jgi:hypothetical protein